MLTAMNFRKIILSFFGIILIATAQLVAQEIQDDFHEEIKHDIHDIYVTADFLRII